MLQYTEYNLVTTVLIIHQLITSLYDNNRNLQKIKNYS